MVGWHHQLDEHEFEQAPGVGDGQGSLTCCSPWGHKESDTTERLNWKKQTFKLWCWRRLLRVPWTARRWNQSILKEINPEYSLEGLMLKLKLQPFDHLMWRADSLDKTLKLGKIDGRRRKGIQKMRWFDGLMTSLMQWTWIWANSRRWWRTGNPGMCSPWGHKELDRTEGLNNSNNNNKKKWKINGEHRKAFVPRNPTGSCLVSMAGLHFLAFFEVRCYHVNSFGQWNVSGKTLHDESLDEHSQTVDSLTAALWDLEQWPNSVMPRLKETIILGCSFK